MCQRITMGDAHIGCERASWMLGLFGMSGNPVKFVNRVVVLEALAAYRFYNFIGVNYNDRFYPLAVCGFTIKRFNVKLTDTLKDPP